jgi:hypothetical protein
MPSHQTKGGLERERASRWRAGRSSLNLAKRTSPLRDAGAGLMPGKRLDSDAQRVPWFGRGPCLSHGTVWQASLSQLNGLAECRFDFRWACSSDVVVARKTQARHDSCGHIFRVSKLPTDTARRSTARALGTSNPELSIHRVYYCSDEKSCPSYTRRASWGGNWSNVKGWPRSRCFLP